MNRARPNLNGLQGLSVGLELGGCPRIQAKQSAETREEGQIEDKADDRCRAGVDVSGGELGIPSYGFSFSNFVSFCSSHVIR